MAKLKRSIARNIVTEAFALHMPMTVDQIQEPQFIENIDLREKEQIHERIVGELKWLGFRTAYSFPEFSQARTVGEVIDVVVSLTESGGPD